MRIFEACHGYGQHDDPSHNEENVTFIQDAPGGVVLNQNIDDISKKVRKDVKRFRKGPKVNEVLQANVVVTNVNMHKMHT